MVAANLWFSRSSVVSRHLNGALTLATGAINFTGNERFNEPIEPAFKVVVVLTGQTSLQIGTHPRLEITGPAVLAVFAESVTSRDQIFAPDATYRYALVDVDPDIVRNELGIEPRALFETHGMTSVATGPADKAVQAVAAQILACPQEASHQIYRLAKAMELVALVLESLRPQVHSGVHGRLSSADIDRIHRARDTLVRSMISPPDTRELALCVGLNVRKLNLGFRMIFGATPYAFLQEHRLQTAYRLLSSGERSVGEAAHMVGYTATHLATLFARRFGLAPGKLIPRSALTEGGTPSNADKLLRTK